jgi:hypothetical protein
MGLIDAVRTEATNYTHWRDEKIEKGLKNGDAVSFVEGLAASIVPMDLVKVASGGAEKTSDYLWAGVDLITLPVRPLGVAGKSLKVMKFGKYLGGATLGLTGVLAHGHGSDNLITYSSNPSMIKQAQENFIKWYKMPVKTLDVLERVKKVYPNATKAILTIDASNLENIKIVQVSSDPLPPRSDEDIVHGWESGYELQRQNINGKNCYVAFPCRLDVEGVNNNEKIWIILGLLLILGIVGYLIYRSGK